MTTAPQNLDAARSGPNQLLDFVLSTMRLKNDAALSRALKVAAPVISKIRHGRLTVSSGMVIKIHLLTSIPVRDIFSIMGVEPK